MKRKLLRLTLLAVTLALVCGGAALATKAAMGKAGGEAFGVQGGVSPWEAAGLTPAYDYVPEKSDTTALPAYTDGYTAFVFDKRISFIAGKAVYIYAGNAAGPASNRTQIEYDF